MPSGRRHYQISLADALSAHERALQYGGLGGIPNIELVESAIARPYSGYYRPIAKKVAALVQSVATNHGFADGNKRTTVILSDLLLSKSGYEIRAAPGDVNIALALEEIILETAQGTIGFDELVAWFKLRIHRLP